jgi:hypothetical protein
MFEEDEKKALRCFDCKGALELIEYDSKKSIKIMRCKTCGLNHLYQKGLLGDWKLVKAAKSSKPSRDY